MYNLNKGSLYAWQWCYTAPQSPQRTAEEQHFCLCLWILPHTHIFTPADSTCSQQSTAVLLTCIIFYGVVHCTKLQTRNTHSETCKLSGTLLEVSFPPSRTSTPGGVQGKPGGLSKTPATCPTVCSLCCPQGDVAAASDPALAD